MSLRVAIVGASGTIGTAITTAFLNAYDQKLVGEVRLTTRKASPRTQALETAGANVFEVDYTDITSLISAFKDVDVVISAIGIWKHDATRETSSLLLKAMAKAGVKVYFPSEFGTNHYARVPDNYKHPKFDEKQEHIREAQALGLKVIALFSLSMNSAFPKWFGPAIAQCKHYGDGNTAVALITLTDLGQFAVQAAIGAMKDLDGFPNQLEIYSDLKTIREYAEIFERVSGRKSKIEFVALAPARDEYLNSPENFSHSDLVTILMAEGVYNFTDSRVNGNVLLNPNESVWKLTKAEDYATALVSDWYKE